MLTKEEKETIINFNEAETSASVEVPVGSKLYKKFCKLGLVQIMEYYYDGKVASVVYQVPKNWIKVNPARNLNSEQRAKCSDRARKNLVQRLRNEH